jgi:hypothetical protein
VWSSTASTAEHQFHSLTQQWELLGQNTNPVTPRPSGDLGVIQYAVQVGAASGATLTAGKFVCTGQLIATQYDSHTLCYKAAG